MQDLKNNLSPAIIAALDNFLAAFGAYEQADQCPSYGTIEGPKIELADALLRFLGIPTVPVNKRHK